MPKGAGVPHSPEASAILLVGGIVPACSASLGGHLRLQSARSRTAAYARSETLELPMAALLAR